MEFIIHPYEGVEIPGKGMIRFGMTRDEVRAFFEEEPKEFFKTTKAKIPTDAFDQYDIHCFYDESLTIEAFEFGFSSSLFFKSRNLFSFQTTEELKNFLNNLGANLVPFDSGFHSVPLGISLYSPDPSDDPIEGIIVFRRNYL